MKAGEISAAIGENGWQHRSYRNNGGCNRRMTAVKLSSNNVMKVCESKTISAYQQYRNGESVKRNGSVIAAKILAMAAGENGNNE